MPEETKIPLPVQLAKFSWAAPLTFSVVSSFVSTAQGDSSNGITSTVLTVFGALLFLSGLVAGIAAMAGISSHGRKGILIPASIGIIYSGAMFALIVTTFGVAYARASDPQAQLEAAAEALRADLPRMVDSDTELVDVISETGHLIYAYRLVKFQSGELDLLAFDTFMRPQLLEQLCEPMAVMWEAGFTVTSKYNTADHLPFSELAVTGKDCRAPAR